ncbi:MAG: GNAT family N-acetyltransferase [Pseudomonadales bacterium]
MPLLVEFIPSIDTVGATEWNCLATASEPFLRYEFLHALEASGSVSAETGWQPFHITVRAADKTLRAVMPLYIKDNSYGEYVFDWSWAHAYSRNGLDYYPKLMSSVPFTPATGSRLLVDQSSDKQTISAAIFAATRKLAKKIDASSWHILFPEDQECQRWEDTGMLTRLGCQFHWMNDGFTSFDDFLKNFAARKRKALKRERRRVQQQDIKLTSYTGTEISEVLWEAFYEFYQFTYYKRGQQGYLNKDFFLRIAASMPENLVMVLATLHGKPVGSALCFKNDSTLFGRYWGCREEYDCLHFEACYYQGIDYCIAHGLQRFDPGAQGEHKIQRGFIPVKTWSNHWISHPDFNEAIVRFLDDETRGMESYRGECCSLLPFNSQYCKTSAVRSLIESG